MDKIAVLIPCYNEAATIDKVVRDFRAALPEARVYVYDNNSTDGTARIAEQAGAEVRHEYRQGKGCVVRRMFREVDALCYVLVDGDDTYPADAAPAMCEPVLSRNADMVVGDRLSSTYYEQNKRPFHNFGNALVKGSINLLFKSDIKDIMTGYRAFSYEFVKTFPILSHGFEIETEMSIHAVDKGLQVENVVVDYRDRPKGSTSKLATFPDGIRVLRTIGKMFRTYHPLKFFCGAGVIMGIVALALFIPVLVTYAQTGMVPRLPTLIMSGFMALAALESASCGFVLENINRRNRQDFEFKLMQVSLAKKRLMCEGELGA